MRLRRVFLIWFKFYECVFGMNENLKNDYKEVLNKHYIKYSYMYDNLW